MLALTQAFLLIALRRLGPEDLPDSGFLLVICAVAYAGLQTVVGSAWFGGFTGDLLRSVLADLALLAGCTWGLLRLTGHPARYRRTLTALLGTGALLTLFIWPFTLFPADASQQPPLIATLGFMAVLIWSVAANGHILARALSAPFLLGIAVAIGYFLLNSFVLGQLAPTGGVA